MTKRLVDIAASLAGLLIAAPVLLAAAIMVKMTSPGPVFYRAGRVGRDGVPFSMYKFRSMVVTADHGPKITGSGDRRITAVGRWLRKTKIDEIPQLINVLRGEMSLVGPRPEDPEYVALYDERQRRVLTVRPGMTSVASIKFRDEEAQLSGDSWHDRYVSTIMPAKLELELRYLERQSLLNDLRIIGETLLILRPGSSS
jgi:lipopolysaccharide/colanic/teichoic acid biosynthesis glycosyltransferase